MKENNKLYFSSIIMFLALLISFTPAAFAEENQLVTPKNIVSVEKLDNGMTQTIYEMELSQEDFDKNGVATSSVDSSFTMKGTYYRGADRKYDGNYLNYTMIVTTSSGNSNDRSVSIQLWDYNHTNALQTDIVEVDGMNVTEYAIPIVANRTYYFKYYLVSGSVTNIKIRMIINSWS